MALIFLLMSQSVVSQPIIKKDSVCRDADLGLNNTWNTFKVRGKLTVATNYVVFSVRKDSLLLTSRFYQFNNHINDLRISTSDVNKVRRRFDFNPTNFSSALVFITNDRVKYKFYYVKNKREIVLYLKKII